MQVSFSLDLLQRFDCLPAQGSLPFVYTDGGIRGHLADPINVVLAGKFLSWNRKCTQSIFFYRYIKLLTYADLQHGLLLQQFLVKWLRHVIHLIGRNFRITNYDRTAQVRHLIDWQVRQVFFQLFRFIAVAVTGYLLLGLLVRKRQQFSVDTLQPAADLLQSHHAFHLLPFYGLKFVCIRFRGVQLLLFQVLDLYFKQVDPLRQI